MTEIHCSLTQKKLQTRNQILMKSNSFTKLIVVFFRAIGKTLFNSGVTPAVPVRIPPPATVPDRPHNSIGQKEHGLSESSSAEEVCAQLMDLWNAASEALGLSAQDVEELKNLDVQGVPVGVHKADGYRAFTGMFRGYDVEYSSQWVHMYGGGDHREFIMGYTIMREQDLLLFDHLLAHVYAMPTLEVVHKDIERMGPEATYRCWAWSQAQRDEIRVRIPAEVLHGLPARLEIEAEQLA